MTPADPIPDLIAAHLSGTIDAAGAAQLRAWLEADRAHRVHFVRATRFHEEVTQLATEQARRRSEHASAQHLGVGRSARRRAHARTPRRQRMVATSTVFALAAAVLVLIGLWVVTARDVPSGAAVLVAGTARTDHGQVLRVGAALASGSRVIVSSPARVRWTDGSFAQVDTDSELVVQADGATLHHGRLEAEVTPRTAEMPFAITTTQATITVLGTRFSVTAHDSDTAVAVTSGRVRVTAATGESSVLLAGDAVRATAEGLRGRTLRVAAHGAPSADATHPTIAAALAAAQPGDTVLVLAGRHGAEHTDGIHPALRMARGGQPGAPVILRGAPGSELVFDAWNAVHIVDTAWLELRQLHLRYRASAASGHGGNGIVVERSQHITIADCDISGFGGDGINCIASDHITIADNIISGCGHGPAGVQGGVTIFGPVADADADVSDHHYRIHGNRITRNLVTAPHREDPTRWTGGHGILLFSNDATTYTPRLLIADNLIAGNAGNGISIFGIKHVDVRTNILHMNGREPRHAGGEMHLGTPGCVLTGNILVPLANRPAWTIRPADHVTRHANRVWEPDGVTRAEVAADERIPASPFLVTVDDESQRADFRLRAGVNAGPRP